MRHHRITPHGAVLLKKVTQLHGRTPTLGLGAHPAGSHIPTRTINCLPISLLHNSVVYAHISPAAQAKSKNLPAFGTQALLSVSQNTLDLLHALDHLGNSAGAVHKFPDFGVLVLIRRDERNQADSFSCPCRHLQQAVALRIERPFQFHHVPNLLRVAVLIREPNSERTWRAIIDCEYHPPCFLFGCFGLYRSIVILSDPILLINPLNPYV
jgi:hypothetical protein